MPIGGRAYLLHRLAWRAACGDDPLEGEEAACEFTSRHWRPPAPAQAARRSRVAQRRVAWRTAVEYAARVEELAGPIDSTSG